MITALIDGISVSALGGIKVNFPFALGNISNEIVFLLSEVRKKKISGQTKLPE